MEGEMRGENAGTHIEISTGSRRLLFFQGTVNPLVFPVAVGKPSTPTPTGNYSVISKIVNPGGILGTRWMGLSIPNGSYGIHGTSKPSSIGTYASHGCIRMYNHDVEKIFPLVSIGTPVIISGSPFDLPAQEKHFGESGKTYAVQTGDTLWKISQRFGVSLDALIQANHLVNPDILQKGQIIKIP